MKRLEAVTNLVVLAVALLVGYAVFRVHFLDKRQSQPNVSPQIGEQIPHVGAYDWSSRPHTLLLVVQRGCKYCEESLPFYRKLAALETNGGSNAHLLGILPDAPADARSFLSDANLPIEYIPGIQLKTLAVPGTPVLILADRDRRVEKVWVGKLSPAAESDVLSAVHKPS